MKLSISDGIDTFQTIEVTTVKEIALQACDSNISTSVFRDGKRNLENFIQADMIGIDIDNDKPSVHTTTLTLAEAKELFKPYKHVILTTRSHGLEKKGIVADRYRVILFLEEPITKTEDFYATWYSLKAQFPAIDIQCKDPSRFWYMHSGVAAGSETGLLVKPVKYVAPPKSEKPAVVAQPGQRGELSKMVYRFLEFGVEAGGRNGTVHKVAKEFQQALYPIEEAQERILNALERNGVIAPDFPETEALAAIASAYSKDPKHEPRLEEVKPRAFTYTGIGELLDRPETQQNWIVDKMLLRGGVSLLVGVPKIGKTTLVRQLERCVLRGEKFLNRTTVKGSVLHYSFDEKERTATNHYRRLGLTKADPMFLHFGSAANEDYKSELEEDLLRIKPTLVVVDTLFDMADLEDINSYGPVKRELSWFSTLAEKTDCHIMFIHHQNKPSKDHVTGSGNSVLGSQAIFGSVDACLIFERMKDSQVRTLTMMGRDTDFMDRANLKYDFSKQIYSMDGPFDPKSFFEG